MVISCIVCGRRNSTYFYKFPIDPIIRKKWADFCEYRNVNDIKAGHRLCAQHFHKEDFIIKAHRYYKPKTKRSLLKPHAVPYIYDITSKLTPNVGDDNTASSTTIICSVPFTNNVAYSNLLEDVGMENTSKNPLNNSDYHHETPSAVDVPCSDLVEVCMQNTSENSINVISEYYHETSLTDDVSYLVEVVTEITPTTSFNDNAQNLEETPCAVNRSGRRGRKRLLARNIGEVRTRAVRSPTRKLPRYIGDVSIPDISTLRQAKTILHFAKRNIMKYRKKIDIVQKRNSRLTKKVSSLTKALTLARLRKL